ncbi:MAG TPA: peptidyl-prolyl cis-trans isomerase [Candidatus Angelobacter sp.]
MIRFWQSGNKAAKYLLGALMTILALSMVTYLIPGFMSDTSLNRSGVVAKVGGQEISTQDVQKFVSMIQQQQRARGQSYPDAFLPYLQQQATEALIGQAELRYESERIGLRVSDEEVRDDLRTGQYAEIFFPGGKWIGQDKYEEILRNAGSTPDDFERQTKLELLRNKLLATVTAGVTVSPAEVEKAYKDQNLKIKFDYAVINADDVKKTINPTESELKAYYEANKARYQNAIQEKRQVRYFQISQKQFEGKVTVSAAEIERYYHDNQGQYQVPERIKVRHILVKVPEPGPDGKVDQKAVDAARAKAEDILKELKAGADFAELAKKYSDDPGSKDQGGDLGWQGRDATFVPEFKEAMFKLNKGQISDPVRTEFGFHLIQVEDKETARLKPLPEVKADIEKTIREQKTQEMLQQMATAAENDARTQTLDKVAAKYGSSVIETPPIGRADALAGIGPDPQLMGQIFSAKEKAPVSDLQTPQGYVFFQVTKVIPSRTPGFEEIKDRVTNDFKGERVNTLVSQKTSELADRAHAEHDLHKAAKEAGATVKTSELVTRSSQVPEIGSMSGPSAGKLFDLKVGEISGAIAAGQNGAVAAILERQEPALTGDDFAKARDNLHEQLLQSKRQEALQLFLSDLDARLRKEGKVKLNQSETGNLGRRKS